MRVEEERTALKLLQVSHYAAGVSSALKMRMPSCNLSSGLEHGLKADSDLGVGGWVTLLGVGQLQHSQRAAGARACVLHVGSSREQYRRW